MIEFRNVSFSYPSPQGPAKAVFAGVNLRIPQGRYTAVMGPNGSGKSTLGKLIKGLLSPSAGQVMIQGMPLRPGEISQRVGYVFSNPENQIVSPVVEEDLAFGLGNLGLEPSEMARRVEESLRFVGLEDSRFQSPHLLSGGQQQKIVIAGILAMKPDILVLDEPTSMLDLRDREGVLDLFRQIHTRRSGTILHITHSFEEALRAQDLIYLDRGRIAFYGPPEDFLMGDIPRRDKLPLPPILQLILSLRQAGHPIPPSVRSYEELKNFLLQPK